MTAAALDPDVAIAAAGRELLESLRELVSRDDVDALPVPDLLDEVTARLRRARGKVGRARRTEEPTPAKAPAEPSKPTVPPTSAAASRPAGNESTRAVTRVVPDATSRRRPERGDRPAKIQGAPMSQPPHSRPRPAASKRRRWWVRLMVAAVILVSLGMATAGIVIMASDGGTTKPSATPTRAFPPPAKPCREVLQPGFILEQDTVGWGCLNDRGHRISAGSYVCTDERWLLVSMVLYQVWGFVGEPLRPVGKEFDPALRDALVECGVTEPK